MLARSARESPAAVPSALALRAAALRRADAEVALEVVVKEADDGTDGHAALGSRQICGGDRLLDFREILFLFRHRRCANRWSGFGVSTMT